MLKLYTDAAVKGNPGLAGIGIVLSENQLHEQLAVPLHGEWDNHEAEWEAVRIGLQYLLEHGKTGGLLTIYTDSKLVSSSIEKQYVKNERFKPYFHAVTKLLDDYSYAEVKWIPDSQNKGADNLARQGLRKAEKWQKARQYNEDV